MARTTKSYSTTLPMSIAGGLEIAAQKLKLTPGLMIADIVERYFVNEGSNYIDNATIHDLKLLRELRDEAIEKMWLLVTDGKFPTNITFLTFVACQQDYSWLESYEQYIDGAATAPGNPKKTNANQTIGSRIKSALDAVDVTDDAGKVQRGRAPVGSIIQTYQLLKCP